MKFSFFKGVKLRTGAIVLRCCAIPPQFIDAVVATVQTDAGLRHEKPREQRVGNERNLFVADQKIAFFVIFCVAAMGFFLAAAPSLAIADITNWAAPGWLPHGPLAEINESTRGSLGEHAAATPSVPEPWNYVSAIATVIPVGLLYWGLRRGRKTAKMSRSSQNP